MDQVQFKKILQRYRKGKSSDQERAFVEAYYAAFDARPNVLEQLTADEQLKFEQLLYEDLRQQFPTARPIRRVHLLKTAWLRYAAAVLIVFGIGTYLYVTNQKEKPSVTQNNPNPVQNDVAPGGNKAILTLADGSKIVLDSAHQGTIAKESNATVIKTAEGKIEYQKGGDKVAVLTYNTMATPRGGQYQLTLPDGSQVWLNAESSITYPTAFASNERKVSITGEAYFEVAKNKVKPFRVDIGTATIEVLGTKFNVNTYKEEPIKNATLLEGSVRIKTVHTSIMLKPGQQGQLSDRGLFLADRPDLEQVMAWKNGAFNFDKMEIGTALRQLARWYDIDIVYPDGVPSKRLLGGIGRDLNLSQVLKVLEGLGVKAELKGRKLYISEL
jgi:transmembrane sensor